MSVSTTGAAGKPSSEYSVNDWLVDEMYEKFLLDRDSVDRSWWPTLESYEPVVTTNQEHDPSLAAADGRSSRTASTPIRSEPFPTDPPETRRASAQATDEVRDAATPLRGTAKSLALNMDASLSVPTATGVRTVPAKLMVDNRTVINDHLRRRHGGKVSITHLVAWAVVRSLKELPSQNVYYQEIDGRPSALTPSHVSLGIAIDISKAGGDRSLVVPAIRQADAMSFDEFVAAYEELVSRARANQLTAGDFERVTISLTNPGGVGTKHSVPRLMRGQGSIIGVGALDLPAEFRGASPKTLAALGVGKTLTLTSTYDHRVIQGAGSGEFLKLIDEHLTGGHGFYDAIFTALRIPYEPIRWAADLGTEVKGGVDKATRVQDLINSFRVSGHLMADVDPLDYRQRSHPDLELASHGLSLWDLDREFATTGIGGGTSAPLREILGVLHESYCRTTGIEYMHIADPAQRHWFQAHVERPYAKPSKSEQLRVLGKLTEAEVFETFLQKKYVGQTRFSLEGAESLIPLLDTLMRQSLRAGLEEVAIGMAHRGRLNVLTNIAGMTYGQLFREFEGMNSGDEGSGDVKYHLGNEGTYRSVEGEQIPVSLAANPSHLEAVDGVLEGIVRGKLDRGAHFGILPVLIHGDAAFAGQGVVVETLQMSQLPAYHTGGTVRININNQVGFTTLPEAGRSSTYSTDVAKTVQAPVFHVNGEDPEAVVRVAELAFAYRQRFHRDVVIDLICYRRRGHNEADEPSMTQPQMYDLVEAKHSVRELYAEALRRRGDISADECQASDRDFQARLERAFAETKAAETGTITVPPEGAASVAELERMMAREHEAVTEPETTGVSTATIELIGDASVNKPDGFTVHPKLQALLEKRREMSRSGAVDWAFAEVLALGSLLAEGTPVRMAGQDTRRGTFAQRHAVLHDRATGDEWSPLANLTQDQARFWVYDSLLSEYAALAFEYGYSAERAEALVLWEAQFGDFVNGAQIVIDEFVSSAEQKWGQRSGVVLLLPHGYEGQGPDHSSARIERFLQLCAEENMTVAQPSSPASYFHLLRRHAHTRPRQPLVVMTPKSMLRMRAATSSLDEFTSGRFEPVLDDGRSTDTSAVRRAVLVSGKLYYDLLARLAIRPDPSIAILRIEQLYPLPVDELNRRLQAYPNAEIVWAQEEPKNQGAWTFLLSELAPSLPRPLRLVSRTASAAPATGSAKRHAREQEDLVDRVLS
ncbi:multifunctional oxoglutarate decarboxylase/oxoglutarate dehydrogenase thiamine pyrophosphate-binding subunit/dihydrolipoyllysine-residue succinyltransferase subunit [Micromonospora parathelypteridis]|uniref:2-oxoglutarate dehydrogenase E1 component n=1 Tax=Micromonospora parathelypteridis TaxID=1839617 RepID=A0A840VZ17_9ACTN|nr:multifunctional oxoglutarate decarboxylase/oxoglutarate dehydrogenase thiamine pyrophosphate-binding subunit/dihydrolipoyllysine-residue succinyltransferase subunit [Micromonospora parathelypteridis]MBB5476231.1 2-oxoglutarate dehydrogenase E1 component [Micromonospora parathelypteridis]